ncbi:hypothetical protein BJ138DRAFT_1096028 [Hygrophoropsis aurantiaca]|uniref:Uncharacterized protein n=1 Tax=Hygrophoropsis aurantiaca TaxID=72124 RepID=A0ACB7ZSN8_9AGAM|nr:hypothetical protein BJ138DRAFT_1096028 [Hygrophoropsis aurantiaca]
MPGRAKSAVKKKREAREAHDDLMARAVSAYRFELEKKPGTKHRSARTICNDFEKMNLEATGIFIKLSHATLARHAAGGRTVAEMNAAKSWLTDVEVERVLAYVEEIGNRGFPLSHRRLREHVNEICRTRLGMSFTGVGKKMDSPLCREVLEKVEDIMVSPT